MTTHEHGVEDADWMPPCECMVTARAEMRHLGSAAARMSSELHRLAIDVETAVVSGDELRVLSATAAVNALMSALVERMNQLLSSTGFYGEPEHDIQSGGYL